MPNFRYRALTQNGEIVNGTLSAPTSAEVARRIEYLKLLPIETIEDKGARAAAGGYGWFGRPSAAEITTFTRDMALLLKAGARLDAALELLSGDSDVGRLRPVVGKLRAALLGGESFADAVCRPSGAVSADVWRAGAGRRGLRHARFQVLEMLGAERARSEAMRRKLTDAMQYPAFVLVAAAGVMLFFILFVLPQFSAVLQDFGTKHGHRARRLHQAVGLFAGQCHRGVARHARRSMAWSGGCCAGPAPSSAIVNTLSRMPGISGIFQYYRTSLFCRNLGVLLGSGVNLTATLRILVDIMAVTGSEASWTAAADRVRHGGKLSDALSVASSLPPMAVRMLRLGEETGQLPALAGRVAEFYEAKLQRSLDRVVGIVGPLAIVTISTVVGGLIVSVMTALLSVTQLVN